MKEGGETHKGDPKVVDPVLIASVRDVQPTVREKAMEILPEISDVSNKSNTRAKDIFLEILNDQPKDNDPFIENFVKMLGHLQFEKDEEIIAAAQKCFQRAHTQPPKGANPAVYVFRYTSVCRA